MSSIMKQGTTEHTEYTDGWVKRNPEVRFWNGSEEAQVYHKDDHEIHKIHEKGRGSFGRCLEFDLIELFGSRLLWSLVTCQWSLKGGSHPASQPSSVDVDVLAGDVG